jgi:uncharacterized membrane protein YkoI
MSKISCAMADGQTLDATCMMCPGACATKDDAAEVVAPDAAAEVVAPELVAEVAAADAAAEVAEVAEAEVEEKAADAISDVDSLKTAIEAYDPAADKDGSIKASLIAAATKLDALDALPEGWAEETTDDPAVADESEKVNPFAEIREAHLEGMGVKSAEVGADAFMCASDRKVHPAEVAPCADCRGGCSQAKGLPGLIEAEAIALGVVGGKVLDSGYSDTTDMFVVDAERLDGKVAEVYLAGDGEVMGWHLLPIAASEAKADPAEEWKTTAEAAAIALDVKAGEVIGVAGDSFEGTDAYAVDIQGADGKSYDVYVGLDGKVLGYDEWVDELEDGTEAKGDEPETEVKTVVLSEIEASLMEFRAIEAGL